MSTSYKRPPTRPAAVAEAHYCPVRTCLTLVSPGHVSCRYHWRQVPSHRRDPLVEAFRRREEDPFAYALAVDFARDLVLRYGR